MSGRELEIKPQPALRLKPQDLTADAEVEEQEEQQQSAAQIAADLHGNFGNDIIQDAMRGQGLLAD